MAKKLKEIEIGDHFADFKIERVLGTGGMGQVYLAFDIHLERRVAIKILPKLEDPIAGDLEKRFLSEARSLALLNHPNIVSVYNLGKFEGVNFIVMEYVEGITLREAVKSNQIDISQSLKLFQSICTGLQAIHTKGILHRDIKPNNIIIQKGGACKIVDFGIAKNETGHNDIHTRTNCFVGTIQYTAPEVLMGGVPGKTSDVFSAGIVLYEMLTGRHPFLGENKFSVIEKIKTQQAQLPGEVLDLLPDHFDKFFKKLTSNNYLKRFQSMDDVLYTFSGFSFNDEITATSASATLDDLSIAGEKKSDSSAANSREENLFLLRNPNTQGVLETATGVFDESGNEPGSDDTQPPATLTEEHSLKKVIDLNKNKLVQKEAGMEVAFSDEFSDLEVNAVERKPKFNSNKNHIHIPQKKGLFGRNVSRSGERGVRLRGILFVGLIIVLGALGYHYLNQEGEKVISISKIKKIVQTNYEKAIGVNEEKRTANVQQRFATGTQFLFRIKRYNEETRKVYFSDKRKFNVMKLFANSHEGPYQDQGSKRKGTLKWHNMHFFPPLYQSGPRPGQKEEVKITEVSGNPSIMRLGNEFSYKATRTLQSGWFDEQIFKCEVSRTEKFSFMSKTVPVHVVICIGEDKKASLVFYHSTDLGLNLRAEIRRPEKPKIIEVIELESTSTLNI